MVQIKRVYEPSRRDDGYRVLVDRLWPRGISKQELKFDEWLKDLAPSTALRKEFGHDQARWKFFAVAYKKELNSPRSRELLEGLARRAAGRKLTLLYGARDETHNNAVVLKDVLEKEFMKSKR